MPTDGPIDWNLPNAELARIWRMPLSGVWRRRRLAGNPHPQWSFKRDFTRTHPDFLAAVAAEEARAAAWTATAP